MAVGFIKGRRSVRIVRTNASQSTLEENIRKFRRVTHKALPYRGYPTASEIIPHIAKENISYELQESRCSVVGP